LRIRVESAEQSLDALADQFMVVGHKKLHDVSACRPCALVFPTVISPVPDADGASPVLRHPSRQTASASEAVYRVPP
jgi:hypothetical protein